LRDRHIVGERRIHHFTGLLAQIDVLKVKPVLKRGVAMDIREHVAGTVAVLEPLGRMVLSEYPTDTALKDRVAAQLHDGRRQFVLDLHQVSQMDTSGLTALVTAYITVQKQQGRIALVNPQKRVAELLHVTKLDTLFQVFDREDDAVESLTQQSQTQG
jgi:anti-anti-sigma factor